MSNFNKVVWAEGVFLSPQHFQQQDRYHENNLNQFISISRQNFYGFLSLEINKQLLASGNFQLAELSLIFPDGTLFHPTNQDLKRLSISLPTNTPSTTLYLAVSVLADNVTDTSFDEDSQNRYYAFEKKINDSLNAMSEPKEISISRLNVRLILEDHLNADTSKIPIALISSNSDGVISIEEDYIPPFLSSQNQPILKSYINEIYGLITQKSRSLAQAVSDPNRGGTIEIIDFLLLQTVNRYQAYLLHFKESSKATHPEDMFVVLSTLCADLMTFLPERVVGDLPIYNHNDIANSFSRLMLKLRKSLSTMIDQRVIRIAMEQRDISTYTAQAPDQSILDTASFVLAVKADIPTEELRIKLPNTMKIATVEKLNDLVGYQLPGVRLLPLATAPRELPFHSGYVYFELERTKGYWELFNDSSAMAFHVSGDFPNIDFEFWAIKQAN